MCNLKKIVVCAVLFSLYFSALALKTGDNAVNVTTNWYNSKTFQAKYNTIDERNRDVLKVILFCQLTNDGFNSLTPLVKKIGNDSKVNLALIAANDSEVKLFLSNNKGFPFPITADKKAVNLYMAGSLLYPKAFVINYKNQIIWDGELIDLPEMIDKFRDGTYNLQDNIKISEQLSKIQLAMRSGDDIQADKSTKAILAIDPSNSPALRMRLFMLENTNRHMEAYALLNSQKAKNLNDTKLYLLMLDLATRYPELAENGAILGDEFAKRNLGNFSDKVMFSLVLLNSFDNNIEAIKSSQNLLNLAKKSLADVDKTMQALYYSTSGLLAYKTGQIEPAINLLSKAVSLDEDNQAIIKQLEFFKAIKNLNF